MSELKVKLAEEIKEQFEELRSLLPGSGERANAVEDLTKLYKLRIEETKADQEYTEKCDKRILEAEQKLAELNEQAKDRNFKLIAEVGLGAAYLIFYGVWMRKGFKFEETGTFTSSTFKGLTHLFKPTKR